MLTLFRDKISASFNHKLIDIIHIEYGNKLMQFRFLN